jgi:hypothetical protein
MTVSTSWHDPTRNGLIRVCLAVSPLFNDVIQCLGTPLLEIKKSELLSSLGRLSLGFLGPNISGIPLPRQLWSRETEPDPPGHPIFPPGKNC